MYIYIIFVTAPCIITKPLTFVTMRNTVKIWGVIIIVVGDTPSSVEINAGGVHWGPIQDGGRTATSAPIGSISL